MGSRRTCVVGGARRPRGNAQEIAIAVELAEDARHKQFYRGVLVGRVPVSCGRQEAVSRGGTEDGHTRLIPKEPTLYASPPRGFWYLVASFHCD